MNTDATYKYGMLNTKQLKCDPEYQRGLDANRVKQIAEHFNPLKVNPIKVSHRDGAYWIFDGQHTTSALVTRNGNQDLMVECKIYEGLSQQDEAELFARQNEYEKKICGNEQMKALYTSGDIEIIDLKKTIESCGFVFDFSLTKTTNKIACCSQMYKIFTKTREQDFRNFMEIIKRAWHGDPDSLRKEIIGGVWLFYITYKKDISMEKAITKFSKVSPVKIFSDGKLYKDFKGEKKYAYVLASIYNKKESKKLDLTILQ